MPIYSIKMHRDQSALLGADQTAPGGIFTSTDFDKSRAGLIQFLRSDAEKRKNTSTLSSAIYGAEKFMVAYRSIALQMKKPYDKADLEEWKSKLVSYGVTYPTVMLSAYRQAHEAGLIAEAAYNPAKYLSEHPEQKPDPRSWYEQLADMLGKKVSKILTWGGIGVAAYFILPKLLLTGVKAYAERKKAV